MFLITGQVRYDVHDQVEVNTSAILEGLFFRKITDIIKHLYRRFKHFKHIGYMFSFEAWLTVQSKNFVVFFMIPNNRPVIVEWNEIIAVAKEMKFF